jgi:APA family basic amino acid/polyamine antiporter
MFGIGNTIGAGVFALTGIAAQYTGPSLFLSFIICGIISLMTALVYSEFSSKMPCSGSSYRYIYSTFGELPAWIIGWNMNLRYGLCGGALARGWASYTVGLFKSLGIVLPLWLYSISIGGY